MTLGDRIINHIHAQLLSGNGSVGLDSNLAAEGQLDSTAMLELVLWVGDTFDIAIQAEDFTPENFGTPRHIVEFVERRGQTGAGMQKEIAVG